MVAVLGRAPGMVENGSPTTKTFSLRSCRSSSVLFLLNFCEGNLVGIFWTQKKVTAQNFRGNFRSIFREVIRASKNSFVPTSFCRRTTLTKTE